MKKRNLILFLLAFVLCSKLIFAQKASDTLSLKEIEITAERGKIFSAGSRITVVDSVTKLTFIHADLSELLSEYTPSFVKSYGPGGIATASLRGTEARHTSVLWNGFSINSPTLGLNDLALVPVNFFNQITAVEGSSASLYGTSAIGGVINLQNQAEFFSGLKINYSGAGGSFGKTDHVLNVEAGNYRFLSSTRLFYDQNKNNFPFTDYNNKKRKQENGEIKNIGLMQNFYYQANNSILFSSGIWYQVTHREIPPIITVPASVAEQKDSVLRACIEITKKYSGSAITFRTAYFNEYEIYSDSMFHINAPYKIISYKAEAEDRFYLFKKFVLNVGGSWNHYQAHANEYNGTITKNYFAAFTELRYDIQNNFLVTAEMRKDFVEGTATPIAPSLGVEKMFLNNFLVLKAKGGKNFNLPSLNDLYWVPGGNPELKPENGWSYETGCIIHPVHQNNFSVELTYFSSMINDWIQWQPATAGYYAPMNLKQVHTRGIQASVNYNLKWKNVDLIFSGNYGFTKSTTIKSDELFGEATIGKQLIYVPEQIANAHIHIAYKKFLFTYSHSYTGKIFTTSDNSFALPSWQIANTRLEKKIQLKKNSFGLFFKVNNLFDKNYQIIAFRAMPGRNYEAGINFQLNFIKSNDHEK